MNRLNFLNKDILIFKDSKDTIDYDFTKLIKEYKNDPKISLYFQIPIEYEIEGSINNRIEEAYLLFKNNGYKNIIKCDVRILFVYFCSILDKKLLIKNKYKINREIYDNLVSKFSRDDYLNFRKKIFNEKIIHRHYSSAFLFAYFYGNRLKYLINNINFNVIDNNVCQAFLFFLKQKFMPNINIKNILEFMNKRFYCFHSSNYFKNPSYNYEEDYCIYLNTKNELSMLNMSPYEIIRLTEDNLILRDKKTIQSKIITWESCPWYLPFYSFPLIFLNDTLISYMMRVDVNRSGVGFLENIDAENVKKITGEFGIYI